MYRLVTIQTRGVTCIIYRARGESCWRMCVHLYGIEPGIGGLRITGSNVDTLLADYRAALKQFSTATLRLSLSLSLPFYPFPLLFPGFFPATRSAWIFFLFPISPSVLFPLYAALSERRLDRWVLPSRRELSPRGAEKDRAEFCSFLVLSPPLLHRFVSHDFRNISSIDQIRFIVNEWLQLVASDFQFVQLSMVVSQNRRCFVRVTRKIWCFLTSLFFCAGIDC